MHFLVLVSVVKKIFLIDQVVGPNDISLILEAADYFDEGRNPLAEILDVFQDENLVLNKVIIKTVAEKDAINITLNFEVEDTAWSLKAWAPFVKEEGGVVHSEEGKMTIKFKTAPAWNRFQQIDYQDHEINYDSLIWDMDLPEESRQKTISQVLEQKREDITRKKAGQELRKMVIEKAIQKMKEKQKQ